ncbi:MAG: NAD(+) diphosphatase [Clostridia bacterium]|nr:NAD(+) diphosphatase [Clostridia bacterium]
MIHEIDVPFHNQYSPLPPRDTDLVFCLREDCLLCAGGTGSLRFPTVGECGGAGTYLFSVGDTRCFAGNVGGSGDYRFVSASELRRARPQKAAFAGLTALHLLRWYNDNRFCGRCGKPMRHSDTERAMVCGCGNTVYPKICPAVIVGILHDGKICLTKYNRPTARWSLVAGYTEIGETAEQTVVREVREETGLKVTDVRYYTSQPWGLSGSLLLGYFCRAEGDPAIRVDGEELKEGRWFAPEEIDFENDGFSLTREMIDAFRKKAIH